MAPLPSYPSNRTDPLPLPAALVLLAYPRIYERLITRGNRHEFESTILKCYALASNPPQTPEGRRHRGYLDLGTPYVGGMLGLYTLWTEDVSTPNIFIMFGPGDGYGPGDSCPTVEELKRGNYDPLVQVPML